jgi:hypothetical protein
LVFIKGRKKVQEYNIIGSGPAGAAAAMFYLKMDIK